MRIFICDDRQPQAIEEALTAAREACPEVPRAERIFGKLELEDALPQLFDAFDEVARGTDIPKHPFDGADLVLLDYGLTTLKGGVGRRLTADHVAGYIRAFSSSAYVVSLNRQDLVDFDLKFLVGDFATKADVALNTRDLREPGLWTGRPASGSFCPWYWPTLSRVGKRRRDQVDLLLDDLDRPLLSLMGFRPTLVAHLSRNAIAYLSPRADEGVDPSHAKDVRTVSAWDHFRSSDRTLPKDDRRELVEAFGGSLEQERCPEADPIRKIVARVVAGELDFWFRRDILGPQRLLIDPPHLMAAYPYRQGRAAYDASTWNETTVADSPPYGLDRDFFDCLPGDGFAALDPWIDRPSFWLPLIDASREVEKKTSDMERNNALCFCEDTRRFLPRSECERFATELGTGLDIRYVERVTNRNYLPESAFAR